MLGDISLEHVSLDFGRMVATLKTAKPGIRFALELITHDALKVPCQTEEYWVTMPQVSGRDLARTLRFVGDHPTKLQEVGSLPLETQLELEDANVVASLNFAREELAL